MRYFAKRSPKSWSNPHPPPGTAPGTLTPHPEAASPRMHLIAYGPDTLDEQDLGRDLSALDGPLEQWPVTWIHVDGLGDPDFLKRLGERFGLHALSLEDVVSGRQPFKAEAYDDHLFITLRIPLNTPDPGPATEQISLFLGERFVLTFQERRLGCLDPVRERIRKPRKVLRRLGPDYLAYALTDAVIDHYFPLALRFEGLLEAYEDEVMGSPAPEVPARIHRVGKDLLVVRRTIWSARETLNALIRSEEGLFTDEVMPYLRDCQDHAGQILEGIERMREMCKDLMGLYHSSVSTRMNDIMKVLTLISTIFIPLSFIAGLYGMNFDTESPFNLPELGWRFGYPAVLGLMLVVTSCMLVFFARKGWIPLPRRGRGTRTRDEPPRVGSD